MTISKTQDVRLTNPLDKFATYSIQHVLLVSRSTQTASAFLNSTKSNKEFLSAVNNTKELGGQVNGQSGVYLVLDTRRFSQFSIENLKYDVFINGLHRGSSSANLATNFTMTVLDAVGVSFANYIQWLMDDRLQCNFDGMIFMLRTFFVGHNDDGTTEIVHSETIPMHLFKMDIDLNYAKGAYALEFMPNMNFDVRKHQRYLTISTKTNFVTKSNTLGEMVSSIQTALNEGSEEFYNKIQAGLKGLHGSDGNKNFGRKVRFQITIPDHWAPFKLTGVSDTGAVEILFKKTEDGKTEQVRTDAQLGSIESSPPGRSIPEVLTKVFEKCEDIAKLGNFQQIDASVGFVKFFKYIIGITSTESTLTVHVDVVELTIPKLSFVSDPKKVTTDEKEFYVVSTMPDGTVKRIPKNFFTYDYIFTGKNKDVLGMDIKIQDMQYLLAANLKIGPAAMAQVANDSGEITEAAKVAKDLLRARPYDVIMLPLETDKTLAAFTYLAKTLTEKKSEEAQQTQQQYTKNLSMFYAASPIVVALQIRGNPLIMHKFNMGVTLDNPASSGRADAPDDPIAYRKFLTEALQKNFGAGDGGSFVSNGAVLNSHSYVTSPVFVHVDIKGPSVIASTGVPIDGEYASAVISDNYYIVFRVTNNIQGHTFTQDLELYSHNIFGSAESEKKA